MYRKCINSPMLLQNCSAPTVVSGNQSSATLSQHCIYLSATDYLMMFRLYNTPLRRIINRFASQREFFLSYLHIHK